VHPSAREATLDQDLPGGDAPHPDEDRERAVPLDHVDPEVEGHAVGRAGASPRGAGEMGDRAQRAADHTGGGPGPHGAGRLHGLGVHHQPVAVRVGAVEVTLDGRSEVVSAAGLLRHVDQLVGEEPPPPDRLRRVLPGTEHHVTSCGKCTCVHRPRRISRLSIRMQLHPAEVMPKARLKKSTLGFSQTPPTAFDRIDLRFKIIGNFRSCILPPLCLKHLFFLFFNLSLDQGCNLINNRFCLKYFFFLLFLLCLPLHPPVRHPHHLLRHPISFLFTYIIRLANGEFWLYLSASRRPPTADVFE
jgi:hypothetical protein